MNAVQQPAAVSQDRPIGAKSIRIYLLSLLFYTASHILLVLLPLNANALGASPSQIGLIMGAYMFTSMFLRPVAGRIVDKFGTSRVFTTVLVLHVAVLSLYLIRELWVFALLRMAQGVILSFFSMVAHLMIIEALPDKSRGQGLSLFSLSSMLPYTYGPFLALYFADRVPMPYLFAALIPVGLATLLIGLTVKPPERPAADRPPEGSVYGGETYRWWKDRKLIFPSVIMLLASAIIGTVASFLPLYLEKRGLPYAGLYFMTETAVLVTVRFFGRKFVPTDGRFPAGTAAVLLVLMTAAVMLIRSADSLPILLTAAVCNGLALSMLYPTLVTYVSFIVPERFRGRGIGLFIAAADFGTSVGTWALSLVADAYSYHAMFAGCIWIGAAALLILLGSKKRGVA
ncbi:MFS transporter [Cohnella sp. CFH 77786]|uniref:staphylopine family metallophore export MFS transporter CntE n=1 Tax=Cohnella sp. CFH 77786 TaxID=2662265 RepID=UPI001C608EE4|nr:MFS transporter [Cohnella sp. CFH 77786]MBW5447699.1 MFS transporter [Cohnella sp. CFH 77786]